MSDFDPLNATQPNFKPVILKKSKSSLTGFRTVPKKKCSFFGRAYRWVTQPSTRMAKVWTSMQERGLRDLKNTPFSPEKMDKILNLKNNLARFEKDVIGTHNQRRIKWLVRFHLAGVHLPNKSKKYEELTTEVNKALNEWSLQPIVPCSDLVGALGQLSDLKAAKKSTWAFFANASTETSVIAYNTFLQKCEGAVLKLIDECVAKVEELAISKQESYDSSTFYQEAINIYGTTISDTPAAVQASLLRLQETCSAATLICGMKENIVGNGPFSINGKGFTTKEFNVKNKVDTTKQVLTSIRISVKLKTFLVDYHERYKAKHRAVLQQLIGDIQQWKNRTLSESAENLALLSDEELQEKFNELSSFNIRIKKFYGDLLLVDADYEGCIKDFISFHNVLSHALSLKLQAMVEPIPHSKEDEGSFYFDSDLSWIGDASDFADNPLESSWIDDFYRAEV